MSFDLNFDAGPAIAAANARIAAVARPVVRVPAPSAPAVPAPAQTAPVAMPSPAPAFEPTPGPAGRMIMLRHDPERGYFARFFGFPGHNGNELAMRGDTLEAVVAYLRERNAKIFDQCWLMVAPRMS